MQMKVIAPAVVLATALTFGCSRETSFPYSHAVGTLKVEGTDYDSALIIQFESDGIHVVGGFVSDAPLGPITIGPNNSQKAALQIIPSQGVIVHDGKRQTIANDGRLIWFVGGRIYEQTLVGFPLEETLKRPKEIPNKPDAGDGPVKTTVDPRIGEWISTGDGTPRMILILRANGQFSLGDLENGQRFPDGVTGTWAAEKK